MPTPTDIPTETESAYGVADLSRCAEAGIRAPSLVNSQPWKFGLRDGAVEIRIDADRRLAADRGGWAARMACGAATYNARLALATAGVPAVVEVHPDPADRALVARLRPGHPRPATYAETELYAAIPRRYSNRGPFWPAAVPADVRWRLIEAARGEAAWMDLLVGATAVAGFSEIARSADRVLQRDARYQAEFATWAHADRALDGVPVSAGAPLAEPHDLLPQRLFNDRRRAGGRDYEPEPLIGILGVSGDLAADQITAGQAMQKVLLTATVAGLDTSMISQPIEVPAARDQLRRALRRGGIPQIAIRFGYGSAGHPTPRRPVPDVLI